MQNRHRISILLVALGILASAAMITTAIADDGPRGNPPPKQDGPGPRNGPGGGGPGGDRQGPGGPGPGFHVLPRFVVEKLNLSEDQKKQVEELDKETKAKLEKILTPEQCKILQEARPPRGPGGQGGPGGRGQGDRGPGSRNGPGGDGPRNGPGGDGPRNGPGGDGPRNGPGGDGPRNGPGGGPGDQRQPPPERPAN